MAADVEEELVAAHGADERREDHGPEMQVALVREIAAEHEQRLAFGERADEDERVTVAVQKLRKFHAADVSSTRPYGATFDISTATAILRAMRFTRRVFGVGLGAFSLQSFCEEVPMAMPFLE